MASQTDCSIEQCVLLCTPIVHPALDALCARYGVALTIVGAGAPLPGSHWGAPEAGIVGRELFVRGDTPIHSALHELCHVICMDEKRRSALDTDAGGTALEECGVCYLSILLADDFPGVGARRMMQDMDAWGYSFRLGSTQAWFRDDAEDAREWLYREQLIDANDKPTWQLRT